MPRQYDNDDDWRHFAALRTAGVKVSRRVRRILRNLGEERGEISEQNAFDALIVLQSMGMPIQFEATDKDGAQDHQGMDIIIYGEKPLYLERFALDIKSSQSGVEAYLRKQQEISQRNKRLPIPPRYPYYIPAGEGGNSCRLLQDLAIFILEKSVSHADVHIIKQLKRIEPKSQTGMEELAALIERIFSEEPEMAME